MWFVLERSSKHPIQNLFRFLNSKLTNGTVYEVGILDVLPDPGYLDTVTQPQRSPILTTRSVSLSPPKKKPYQVSGLKIARMQEVPQAQEAPQVMSSLPGVILPPEFQEDPRFHFEGPTFHGKGPVQPEDDPMQDLIDAFSDDENEEPRRTPRNRNRPEFYQSDAVEAQEKMARQEGSKASSSTDVL
jgi:hypothetical protein